MRYYALALAATLASGMSSSASAQTFMEKLECTGDAMRLCSTYVPNHKLVANCMEMHHDQLSQGCMSVFDAGLAELRAEGRPIP